MFGAAVDAVGDVAACQPAPCAAAHLLLLLTRCITDPKPATEPPRHHLEQHFLATRRIGPLRLLPTSPTPPPIIKHHRMACHCIHVLLLLQGTVHKQLASPGCLSFGCWWCTCALHPHCRIFQGELCALDARFSPWLWSNHCCCCCCCEGCQRLVNPAAVRV